MCVCVHRGSSSFFFFFRGRRGGGAVFKFDFLSLSLFLRCLSSRVPSCSLFFLAKLVASFSQLLYDCQSGLMIVLAFFGVVLSALTGCSSSLLFALCNSGNRLLTMCGMVCFRYCTRMSMLLKSRQHAGKAVYHWTSSAAADAAARTNAGYLIASYAVIILGMSPEEAFAPLASLEPSFVGYRDASYNHACA